MSRLQKILLFCSSICLILAIVSLFLSPSWAVIVLILLHSASLLYFCYLNYTSGPAALAREEAAQAEENYRKLLREHEQLAKELEQTKLLCEELKETRPADEETDEPVSADTDTQGDAEASVPERPVPFADMLPPAKDAEHEEPIDIIRVVTDTVGELASFAAGAGIRLQISSTLDTLPVRADHERIRILFRNIIDNSIKYMNRSGCLVITISTIADDIFIVLKDNGDGLSEEETPHIFEMNYQGSNRISGNGLGLTQAKAIVDYYGGTIYARSKPGSGMGIYIQIPME